MSDTSSETPGFTYYKKVKYNTRSRMAAVISVKLSADEASPYWRK